MVDGKTLESEIYPKKKIAKVTSTLKGTRVIHSESMCSSGSIEDQFIIPRYEGQETKFENLKPIN